MALSYDVRVWKILAVKGARRTTYKVPWVVAGGRHSQNFQTQPLADSFRARLITAMRNGEGFDTASGLPDGDDRWGQLTLVGASSRGGVDWTDDGEVYDHRGLKHRPEETVRHVPIPPALVTILREHLAEFGTAADGRLFRGRDDRPLSGQYGKVWRAARSKALSRAEAASPLAGRPYDLRHGGVSLWLNAGVPATDVAARAGHTVAVLLRVYAKCVDGQADEINRRIDAALGELDSEEPRADQ